MNYLKKLIAAFRNPKALCACKELGRRAKQAGIVCQCLQITEIGREHKEEGVLWLMDDAVCAGRLAQAGEAVLYCMSNEDIKEEPPEFSWVRFACERPEELELSYLEGVYRRYRGIPRDICETARCLIRETTLEDVEAFYEIYREPAITRYMENLYDDPEQERAYIRDYIDKVYALYDFGIWTVALKESGQVIGRAGLTCREGFEEPELGFVIGVPWQGKGLAFEVCRAVLNYGREVLGFWRIQALVEPENAASVRLCEKLGFVRGEELEVEHKAYVRFIRQTL
ncbi:MAG: GNAT family N-acetyltransferase [Roseburia sp.]|nr:GNAT family N-acetyltransferase [Roseburia sp.]